MKEHATYHQKYECLSYQNLKKIKEMKKENLGDDFKDPLRFMIKLLAKKKAEEDNPSIKSVFNSFDDFLRLYSARSEMVKSDNPFNLKTISLLNEYTKAIQLIVFFLIF
jgi:hypothetical protein